MNKPITMVIKETKAKLINACNESSLPPIILDLILQGVYSEVHTLAEQQIIKEEKDYIMTMTKDKDMSNDKNVSNKFSDLGDTSESK